MTENEAIEELKFNNEKCLEQCEGACFNRKNNDCACQDEVIERMLDELLQYREIGTVEEFEKLKLAENGNIWGFIDEYVAYKQIGTVEECREYREKQEAKRCTVDSCPDHTHYKCPSCGQIELSIYKHGFSRLGRITKYCGNCGQAIDENLEEMEYERD